VVPVHVATSMDAPNPDAGEERPHTNTQLFGTVAPADNRFLSYEAMQPPFNAPDDPGREPTMDGFVLDYVNTFRSETGRLPGYDEYAQIMSCYTPEQVPVISTIARGFATFDHWFCEVSLPDLHQPFLLPRRQLLRAGGQPPYDSFPQHNQAETIFERLDAAGRSWRVYVDPGMPFSLTGMIHTPRLAKQFATHFSTLDDFFADTDQGRLAAYSFIEPNLLHAHNDYHPAYNAIVPGLSADPPSSILGGGTARSHLFRHPHLLHGGWVQLRQHAVPGQLRRAWRHL
jgi:phospholipase C